MGSVNKFKFFIFDLISFGSNQAICINLILIILILANLPISNLNNLPPISLYSGFVIPHFFNNSCSNEGIFANCGFYSVGQTRALSSFFHGDFEMAFEYNALVLLLLITIVMVLFVNLWKTYKFYQKTGKIFPW